MDATIATHAATACGTGGGGGGYKGALYNNTERQFLVRGGGEVIALCLKHLMTGQSEHYSNFLVIKRVIAAGGRL